MPTDPPPRHPPIAAPLPDVDTNRLTLRRPHPDDLDGLAAVFAKPEVFRFPYGRGWNRNETVSFLNRTLAAWESDGFGLWLVVEPATARIVGYAGLSVPTFLPEILPAIEVGWRLDPDVWGRGYATESATAALDQAFTTLGLHEVCSLPQVDNDASVRVAERLGMRRDSVITVAANDRRGAVDVVNFVITRDEWRDRRRRANP
jgi:RimJ/RimL family protein N-acetyltransferase